MSGLFGYLAQYPGEPPPAVAERMANRLRHRPCMAAKYAAPAPQLSFGRLHIGIFNRGAQPIVSPDRAATLLFTGELYHQSARRAALLDSGALDADADDASLALAVYLRDGAAGLTRLEGAFLIAVWDASRHELILVNDRFGLYPHYYAHSAGGFAWAPEIKGVLCAPGVSRRVDLVAVAQYMRFQHMLDGRTWIEDVQLLPPASLLRYRPSGDRLQIERYWDWDAISPLPGISFDDAVEETIRLFGRGVDAMIGTPHRVGVYLSGGLDSRAILGFVDGKVPVTTITYGMPGCRDVVYAARIARLAHSRHRWFPLLDGRWVLEHAPLHLQLTEGMHSWVHMHGISTLDAARTMIDVNLSGWEGGTILGGDTIPLAAPRSRRERRGDSDLLQGVFDAFASRLTWPGMTEAEAEALSTGRGERRLRGLAWDSLREAWGRSAHYPAAHRLDYLLLEQHHRRLTQNMLVTARSAIEVRCPFYDYEFLALMYAIPAAFRAGGRLQRAVITRRLPRLARVPYEWDDRLPHSNRLLRSSHATLQRIKGRVNRHLWPIFPQRGNLYVDYEQYLRTDLRRWAEDILFDRRSAERGLFDPSTVRALWERHLAGTEPWTIGKIAPLITTETALRSLCDGEEAVTPELEYQDLPCES